MSNYNSDQFYNWTAYEDKSLDPNRKTFNDNPDFLWPPSQRKVANGHATKNAPVVQKVKRGYMRMVTEAFGNQGGSQALKQLGSHRLFFQFNPDTITRSVAARNDIQYWMNMDPIQLTQPIPGDQNFAFELLFNREAEMVSGDVKNFDTFRTSVFREGSTLTDPRNPAVVGVLADLHKFDQIIGQGLNETSINAYLSNARALRDKQARDAKTKSDKSTNTGGKDEEDVEDTIKELTPEEETLIQQNLRLNVGNSAFLVANPIRIVFSSLFMVEGYVTNASVVFNKFNPSMVPTQCIVTVSMQALYIGFAKKDTFLNRLGTIVDDYQDEGSKESENEKNTQALLQGVADTGILARKGDVGLRISGASGLLGNNDTKSFKITLVFSEALKTAVDDGQVTNITAKAEWKVEYLNNTSTKPANTYEYNTTWTSTSDVDVNVSNLRRTLRRDRTDVPFSFSRPTLTSGKLLDRSETSVYKTTIKITFTYTNGAGSTVTSAQSINWTSTSNFEISTFSTNTLNGFGRDATLSNS